MQPSDFPAIYYRAWPRSLHKERASVVYNFNAIWLVYSLKQAFLIGYYNKIQIPEEFWIEPRDREVEENTISAVSYCKYLSRIIMMFRRNIHMGICNGAATEEAIWNGQSTGVWVELEAGATGKWTTAELASLLMRAFERMFELRLVSPQHFDHCDDASRCR